MMKYLTILTVILLGLLFSLPGFSDQATHDLCLFTIDDYGVTLIKIVNVKNPLPEKRAKKARKKQFRYQAINLKGKTVATGYFKDPRLIRGEFIEGNTRHAKTTILRSSFFLRLPSTKFLAELLIEKRKIEYASGNKSETWQKISIIKFANLDLKQNLLEQTLEDK